jgi:hypothetical protein
LAQAARQWIPRAIEHNDDDGPGEFPQKSATIADSWFIYTLEIEFCQAIEAPFI